MGAMTRTYDKRPGHTRGKMCAVRRQRKNALEATPPQCLRQTAAAAPGNPASFGAKHERQASLCTGTYDSVMERIHHGWGALIGLLPAGMQHTVRNRTWSHHSRGTRILPHGSLRGSRCAGGSALHAFFC